MPRLSMGAAAKRADAALLFAALGDETRLRIVARLCEEGPLSIMRLTSGAKVSRQAITKHLHALEEAGLARGSRTGRESVWKLRANRLANVQRYLDQISQDWDAALGRLRAFVENDEQQEKGRTRFAAGPFRSI
jgi:DNA-binding transcriptional ArsR family regulator